MKNTLKYEKKKKDYLIVRGRKPKNVDKPFQDVLNI